MIMIANNNSKIFEVDNELFEEVKRFLKNLAKKRDKSFSYVDDIGDVVIVKGDKEIVVPNKDDILAITTKKDEDFLNEEEVKKLLCIK